LDFVYAEKMRQMQLMEGFVRIKEHFRPLLDPLLLSRRSLAFIKNSIRFYEWRGALQRRSFHPQRNITKPSHSKQPSVSVGLFLMMVAMFDGRVYDNRGR
jgi:hypothetical protein